MTIFSKNLGGMALLPTLATPIALNVEPFLHRLERSYSYVGSALCPRMSHERLARKVLLVGKRQRGRSRTRWSVRMIHVGLCTKTMIGDIFCRPP